MKTFGEQLRIFRQHCYDPSDPARRLSQERLGQLLGMELGDRGFSGAAVSDWERGASKIHADQRRVLTSLIKVLHEMGGIKSLTEANQLLESGNYRTLNLDEAEQVFPNDSAQDYADKSIHPHSILSFLTRNFFFISDDELQIMLTEVEKGPSPSWPRLFVSLTNKLTARWSKISIARGMFWIWTWLLCWASMAPSLNWPFEDQEDTKFAMVIYAAGTLVIPLLIGLLTRTKGNIFWQEYHLDNALITRLYTYQGASIGYHLGYFAVLTISLFGYYAHVNSATIFRMLIALLPPMIGYASARLVPYNLWLAYGRLSLRDGWIFFVFFALGSTWGFYFYNFHRVFLSPNLGALTILFAITIFIMLALLQRNKQKD